MANEYISQRLTPFVTERRHVFWSKFTEILQQITAVKFKEERQVPFPH
jgi:hypothetical protein